MGREVLHIDLAREIEASEIHTLSSKLNVIKAIEGNPMLVDIKTFGHATAFSVKNIPGPAYNTVRGLAVGDEHYIQSIIEFYKQKDIAFRFEITPAHSSPELLRALSEAGFYHADFHTTLYSSLKEIEIKEGYIYGDNISIRRLGEEEFDTFADIYTQAFQMPPFLKESVASNNRILYSNKKWTFYLAEDNNEPAGIAVLFIDNDIANLAVAATLTRFRNKGIQSELIKHRIMEAINQQCHYIVGQAKFASTSQHNMERVGLNIAYTKAIWVSK